jgi:hypothetical protein
MKNSPIRTASVLLLALGLAACGGGDDATATDGGTDTPVVTPAAVTCDSTLFSASVTVPTADQLTAYAKTYAGVFGEYTDSFEFVASGPATLVFNSDGTATLAGASVKLSSVCVDGSGDGEQLVIHWGEKIGNTYSNHVDLLKNGSATGSVDAGIFKSPGTMPS